MSQPSASRSAFGSIRQLRTRPAFSVTMTPASSSTFRCCITAGRDIASGSASALTDGGLRTSRSTIARRVGSASAWKTRPTPSNPDWLGTYLTIVGGFEKVKYLLNYSRDAAVHQAVAQRVGSLPPWITPLAHHGP